MKFTRDYSAEIDHLKKEIQTADAIVIGAGAGLSTAAGFTYSGERLQKYFADFVEKYGFRDMYSGGFYSFSTLEEQWAYWSRYIYINRYMDVDNGTYKRLFELVKDKDYFVITTNVDHQFQKAGFDKHRLFYTQGDYGLWQCSEPCHQKTYDNEETVRAMFEKQRDMRVPSELDLPDVQYHFHDLDPDSVVNHAYTVLSYIYENNCPIESGETIDGLKNGRISRDVQWVCQFEEALVQPARTVMDINTMEFAAGKR